MYDGPTIANLVSELYNRWMTSLLVERIVRKCLPNGRSTYNEAYIAANEIAYFAALKHLDLIDYYTHGNGD